MGDSVGGGVTTGNGVGGGVAVAVGDGVTGTGTTDGDGVATTTGGGVVIVGGFVCKAVGGLVGNGVAGTSVGGGSVGASGVSMGLSEGSFPTGADDDGDGDMVGALSTVMSPVLGLNVTMANPPSKDCNASTMAAVVSWSVSNTSNTSIPGNTSWRFSFINVVTSWSVGPRTWALEFFSTGNDSKNSNKDSCSLLCSSLSMSSNMRLDTSLPNKGWLLGHWLHAPDMAAAKLE